jgi:hypothetical protein
MLRANDMLRLTPAAVSLLLTAGGCSQTDTHVQVFAFSEEGGSITDLEVTALPFDPDRMLDSLAAASPNARPAFPELESEMLAYRRPEAAQLHEIGAAWRYTRDSVSSLADSLNRVAPDSPGYATRYERLRQQYRRLAQRAVERDAEFRAQVGEDRELARRATAAADSLRVWERSAYGDFPRLSDSAVAMSGRSVLVGATDEHGHLDLELAAGPWWLVARLPELENPFVERYWNVPIVVSPFGPARVPLSERTGSRRWRH